MDNTADSLRKFSSDNGVGFETLAKAAGMDLSTFYRKMKKGKKAFTVGDVLGMVDGGVMPREDAIRIFLT